tara:strand:+ start:1521 stop:2576 length:1056 start_codon:yes stop_codon:yes gene_type:complete
MSHLFQLVNTNIPTLFNDLMNNKINLDPEYQRDVVWKQEQRSDVINSIYKNYPIGILLFNKDTKKTFTKICMDGKQRLTSIKEFINNKFPFHNEDTNEYIYYSIKKKDGRKMKPKEKNKFDDYTIVLQEYINLDYSTQCDMFSRIQNGTRMSEMQKLIPCFKLARACPITFKKYIHNISEFFPQFENEEIIKLGMDCLIFFKNPGKKITNKKRQQEASSYSNVRLIIDTDNMYLNLKKIYINYLQHFTITHSSLLVIISYLIYKNFDSINLDQVIENIKIIQDNYNNISLDDKDITTTFEQIKVNFIVNEIIDYSKLRRPELQEICRQMKIKFKSSDKREILLKKIINDLE